MKAWLFALLVLALVAVPRLAHACPVCAGNPNSGYGVVVAIGAMIAFPFTVAIVVARVLRRAGDRTQPLE